MTCRIALANIPFPRTPDESVGLAVEAVFRAGSESALVVCFPECYVPGYRLASRPVERVEAEFLEWAWREVSSAAARANVGVVLGTERFEGRALRNSVMVLDRNGTRLGFQDKVQMDPSEDTTWEVGAGRQVFTIGPITFGIAICHEAFRYPETVRAAARAGGRLVFHPHYTEPEAGQYRPAAFADPANSFHEKAILCRAAENTIYVATVNCATEGSPTTSAIARPDGSLLTYQPYGKAGLLVADLDLSEATGLLAKRWRPA